MKRIKAVNGYTIYQATARDVEKYNVTEGTFYIYFSSDIRDYGISNCDADWEADTLKIAIEWCSSSNYAIAKEIVEANTTAASFEEITEVEKRLDAGATIEEIEKEEEEIEPEENNMNIITNNTREYEHRYLTNWKYNAALILDELETIVLNNGGAIVSTWQKSRKEYAITNRTLSGAIREEMERVEKLEKFNRMEAAAAAREKLEEMQAINNDPRITPYGDFTYICFALNGMYYYYSMDDNPFFDFHYSKTPIVNGEINKCHYSRSDAKHWFHDDFWRWNRPHDDIREAADFIFNMLQNATSCSTYNKPKMEKLIVLAGEMEENK